MIDSSTVGQKAEFTRIDDGDQPTQPRAAPTMEDLKALQAVLPLTDPLPPLLTHVPSSALPVEASLARNPDHLSRWQTYLAQIAADVDNAQRHARTEAQTPQSALLGPQLASEEARKGYQRLVETYERFVAAFPLSYKAWKAFLDTRKAFVLGTPRKRVKLNAPKKKHSEDEGEAFLNLLKDDKAGKTDEGHIDFDSDFEGALDPILGAAEWRALAGTYERALIRLPNMPRFWIDYLTVLTHPSCPAFLSHSHTRHTFNRALRTLPGSLHPRIWRMYLGRFAHLSPFKHQIWSRYLRVDPTPTEFFVATQLNSAKDALMKAKLLLGLARTAAKGKYRSPEGKSPFHLLEDWLDVAEKFAEQVALPIEDVPKESLVDPEDLEDSQPANQKQQQQQQQQQKQIQPANGTDGPLMRLVESDQVQESGTVDEDDGLSPEVDPKNTTKLDVERIVRREGLAKFPDQAGKLWVGLATFWINMGELDRARALYEEGLKKVLTLRDFSTVFDSYSEFSESYIGSLMELVQTADEDVSEEEQELDARMADFEALMDRRPFLVNEVLLRRNPDDVQEWEKRVVLWGNDADKVNDTYRMATETIGPRKAAGALHQLFISWAKFYEQPPEGVEPDVQSARGVLEKAVTIPFKRVDDLAEIWIAWSEMEVRLDNYDEAQQVMARATQVPRKTNISFHDETLSSQARLFKSLKLWSYRADLEESLGDVNTTKAVYDAIFELKIANAQVVVNYATFLEENDYFEESFKVYERALDAFSYPIKFELLNAYLAKFVKRFGGTKMERARDLFEEAVSKCPPKFAKSLFLMYGKLEEEHGLAKRAMRVYEMAVERVDKKDQFEAFEVLVAKTAEYFGLPATRIVYQRAIEVLPDSDTAEMCLRFAALERKLGEIDRARAVYAHGSQFCDPRVNPQYWQTWHAFELDVGSEDTFREYLRIKRAVQARFNTESAYIRSAAARPSSMLSAEAQASKATENAAAANPMDALEEEATAAASGGASGAARAFVPAQASGQSKPATDGDAAPAKNDQEIDLDVDDDEES